ncbi:uncharacterized protein [Clytia hemisphaerica]|uniref:uncharacterized protein n=1 Tax=Clytia hemisphaerica TaxID=252671 RepID=UPI0034D722AC
MDHYRQHLRDLKNQETELLESIRRDKENQLREEENVLIEEIKRQTEKLQRLKDSRSQQHSSRSAPPPETRNSSSGENLTAQSAILNNFPADSMSTLLHRPLLSSQQQQQQTLNPGSSFGNVLPFLNSGSTAEPSSTRQFTQNELFLRPTRTNDVTREFASSLLADVQFYREATYATNTRKAYRTHRKVYLQFCNMLDLPPAPAKCVHLCMYAAYLARFLLPQSVCIYLNIVGLLHREMGFPNPLLDNFFLSSVLKGIKRSKGVPPVPKLPITVEILSFIHSQINLRDTVIFWSNMKRHLTVTVDDQITKADHRMATEDLSKSDHKTTKIQA